MSQNNYTSNNETAVSLALSLGGVVKIVADEMTGEIAPDSAEVSCKQDTARGRVSLSTSHISPFIEWTAGASLFKVSGGGSWERSGGGLRRSIMGFSDNSRRGLMRKIACVRMDAELPVFVTLTYPSVFPDPKQSKKHLDKFIKRLRRKFPAVGGIWKLEPQERGAPHFHILLWGSDESALRAWVAYAWHSVAGDGDENHLLFHLGALGNEPCVNAVRSFRGVWSYASKYLGKTFEVAGWNSKETGRFWAVFNPSCIPFGEKMIMRVTLEDAHKWMRYQKRFSKVRLRSGSPSFTIYCTADQWAGNVIRSYEGGDKKLSEW